MTIEILRHLENDQKIDGCGGADYDSPLASIYFQQIMMSMPNAEINCFCRGIFFKVFQSLPRALKKVKSKNEMNASQKFISIFHLNCTRSCSESIASIPIFQSASHSRNIDFSPDASVGEYD